MIVYGLFSNLIHEFGRTNPKRVSSLGFRTVCADFMPRLPAADRSREGPKCDLAIAMLLTPAFTLRSWPATPEVFGSWGAACFTTLSECSPRHAPKRRFFPKSFRSRITEEPEPWRAKTGVHVRLMVVVRATDWRDLRERTEPKGRSLSVVKVKTRMIRISAAPHGSANSAPRPHRDGRTSNTQSHRLVT
jgi:hypothetical protein